MYVDGTLTTGRSQMIVFIPVSKAAPKGAKMEVEITAIKVRHGGTYIFDCLTKDDVNDTGIIFTVGEWNNGIGFNLRMNRSEEPFYDTNNVSIACQISGTVTFS